MIWYRRPALRGLTATCAALLCVSALGAPLAAAKDSGSQQTARVVVVGRSADHARGHVKDHGTVVGDLSIVNAVAADVTPDELMSLQGDPQVLVVPDVQVDVTGVADVTTGARADVFRDTTGASQLDGDGKGVTVAVLDTGIARVDDLKDRLVGGVDLSGEGDPFRDSYGHGTFVAGLVAGNGKSSKAYKGEAPGASLVSVKVAGASGSTDLVTVLAGIQWAVNNRAALRIGVLNISMGTAPFPSSVLNPLDQAVEAAWRSGIVVVTSAGNTGPVNGTITSPGDDPLVITVGALDDQGTGSGGDDTMTAFSAVGPTVVDGWFKPDLVTSGRSVVSLRVPGSTIDAANPSARIGDKNFVGSGTSFSAAITSGAVAMLRRR